jgi:outer membrane protein
LVVSLLLGAGVASAAKIGFVEVERAIATVEEGKVAFRALEEWAQPRRNALEALGREVSELQQQLQQQAGVASREALERMQQQLRDLGRRFEDEQRAFARDLDVKQNELLRDVARKINVVVTDYGTENDYEAIFIFKDRTLIYLSDGANLTDLIIGLYNERFPLSSE